MSGRKRRYLIALCVAFLALDIIAAAVLALVLWRDQPAPVSRRDALARQVEETRHSLDEEAAERMQQALGEAHRHVTLRSEAVARDGKIAIHLSNGAENPCAVELELVLVATGQVIAQTGLVDPDWRVEECALTEPLAPGTHHCLARLHFYDLNDERYLGATARQVLLSVEDAP